MKKIICLSSLLFISTLLIAGIKDSVVHYQLADSVRAMSFIASVRMQELSNGKKVMAGIQTSQVSLLIKDNKKRRTVVFKFPTEDKILVKGLDVNTNGKNELIWNHNWNDQETYKLYITTAADSAGNFILYSGYIYFPKSEKWKLIGTCKIKGHENTIKDPQSFFTAGKKTTVNPLITDAWCQRSNGSWKNLSSQPSQQPVVLPFSNIDSAKQAGKDEQLIQTAIASGKTDAINSKNGLYYTILRKGSGRGISVSDSVTIFYKGYLLSDGTIFDETKDKPRTFLLNRLIMGWQQGVPLVTVGGKIRLVMPSGLAYNIRTRSAKIPPNSILVFDIDVVDAKDD